MKRLLRVFVIFAVLPVLLLTLFMAAPQISHAASSCVATEVATGVIVYSWTAHTDGTFTSSLCTNPRRVDGWVTHVQTDPGGTAPQALYDITLTDSRSEDIAAGQLANRSATATETVEIGGRPVYGPLTLNISGNNVNGATGQVIIYYVPWGN